MRELENTLHRAVLLSSGAEIGVDGILSPDGARLDQARGTDIAAHAVMAAEQITRNLVGRTVAEVERDLILETLKHCLGNRTHAANILGISIRTLRNKLNEYAADGSPIPAAAWRIGARRRGLTVRKARTVIIYKICPALLWRAAERVGVFRGSEVDLRDGFIHFSSAAQVVETAGKHFAGQSDLLLVRIDSAKPGELAKTGTVPRRCAFSTPLRRSRFDCRYARGAPAPGSWRPPCFPGS